VSTMLQFLKVDRETDRDGGGWGRYEGDVPEIGDILEFWRTPEKSKRFKVVRKEFHFLPHPRWVGKKTEEATRTLFTEGNWIIQQCNVFMIEIQ
jgi:hypothetical protein